MASSRCFAYITGGTLVNHSIYDVHSFWLPTPNSLGPFCLFSDSSIDAVHNVTGEVIEIDIFLSCPSYYSWFIWYQNQFIFQIYFYFLFVFRLSAFGSVEKENERRIPRWRPNPPLAFFFLFPICFQSHSTSCPISASLETPLESIGRFEACLADTTSWAAAAAAAVAGWLGKQMFSNQNEKWTRRWRQDKMVRARAGASRPLAL